MRTWHDFLDSIDTNGGHIVVLMMLILLGTLANRTGFPKAEDVVMGAFGALLLALKEAGSNKERRDTVSKTLDMATVEKKPNDEAATNTTIVKETDKEVKP